MSLRLVSMVLRRLDLPVSSPSFLLCVGSALAGEVFAHESLAPVIFSDIRIKRRPPNDESTTSFEEWMSRAKLKKHQVVPN